MMKNAMMEKKQPRGRKEKEKREENMPDKPMLSITMTMMLK